MILEISDSDVYRIDVCFYSMARPHFNEHVRVRRNTQYYIDAARIY